MKYYDEDEIEQFISSAIQGRNKEPKQQDFSQSKDSDGFSVSAQEIRARFPGMTEILEGAVKQTNRDIKEGADVDDFYESALHNFIIRAVLEGFEDADIASFVRAINS